MRGGDDEVAAAGGRRLATAKKGVAALTAAARAGDRHRPGEGRRPRGLAANRPPGRHAVAAAPEEGRGRWRLQDGESGVDQMKISEVPGFMLLAALMALPARATGERSPARADGTASGDRSSFFQISAFQIQAGCWSLAKVDVRRAPGRSC